MIDSEFWETIARRWCRKETIKIPEIKVGPDIPEEDIEEMDFFKMDEDAWLNDFFGMND